MLNSESLAGWDFQLFSPIQIAKSKLQLNVLRANIVSTVKGRKKDHILHMVSIITDQIEVIDEMFYFTKPLQLTIPYEEQKTGY